MKLILLSRAQGEDAMLSVVNDCFSHFLTISFVA